MNILNFKIRIYRKKLKLRQEDLAQKIDVSTQLIRMYESGTRNPSEDKKKAMCNLFGITLYELEGLNDKEILKERLLQTLSCMRLNDNKDKLRSVLINNFYEIINNDENYISNYIKEKSDDVILTRDILEFILQNYICNSIYTSTEFNSNLLRNKNLYKYLKSFIFSNIRFIEAVIEEVFANSSEINGIPLIEDFSETTNLLKVKNKMPIFKYTNAFAYTIKDNDMTPKFEVGNTIFVVKASKYNDDDYIILKIQEKYVLRKFKKIENGIALECLNPIIKNDYYTNEQMEKLNIKIIGKVIGMKI